MDWYCQPTVVDIELYCANKYESINPIVNPKLIEKKGIEVKLDTISIQSKGHF